MRVMHFEAELNGKRFDLGLMTNDIDPFDVQARRLGRDLRLDAVWGREETKRYVRPSRTDGTTDYLKQKPKLIWKKKPRSKDSMEQKKDPAASIIEVRRAEGRFSLWHWILVKDGQILTGEADSEEEAFFQATAHAAPRPPDEVARKLPK